MALQKKTRLENGDVFSFETVGDKLNGYYVGTDEIPTKYGMGTRHALNTKKGLVTFFGNSQINEDLKDIPVGTYVEIEFTGTKKVKRGTMKLFDFAYDLDDVDTSGVQALNEQREEEQVEEAEDDTTVSRHAAEPEEEEEDSRPLPRSTVNRTPARVDAEKQQRVKEMLQKRSK